MLSTVDDLSLNCVCRSRSPSGVSVVKIHDSSVCSGTSLCMNSAAFVGSIPAANRDFAIPQRRARSTPGSYAPVIA